VTESEPRPGGWIQTHTGLRLWPLDPRPEEIAIEDIAQGLSHLCRFGGQCREFYSVAQHSVLVSRLCEERADPSRRRATALAGLLHDAAEAFIADIPRPVKANLPLHREIEEAIWGVIQAKWGLREGATGERLFDDALLWHCDDVALITEKRDLMAVPVHWGEFEDNLEPLQESIAPVPPAEARRQFLERFSDLTVV